MSRAPTWTSECGRVELWLGDCKELLPMESSCVLADPPYGIKMDEGFEGFGGFGKPIARKRYVGGWDNDRPDAKTFALLLRYGVPAFIFGGNFFADILPRSTHWLVWDKRQTMPTFGDCELVWTNVRRKSVKIITKEWNGLLGKEETRQHATQKPIKIIAWIIESYSGANDIILDPFMGSGTTGVACIRTGRRFKGIEIDPNYFEIAKERIVRELSQPQLPMVIEQPQATEQELL